MDGWGGVRRIRQELMQCSVVAGREMCVDSLACPVAVDAASGCVVDRVNGEVAVVAEGDRDAAPSFDEWVAARGPALVGFAYLVTADFTRAEEAVQDALSRVYGRWSRISRTRDPEPYVRRMIINADISGWRRFGKRETPVADVVPAVTASSLDVARAVTEEDAMWRLCAGLPRRQRAAVVLRYYEDLPDARIAAILGCSESTVRSQIHRALTAMRNALTEEAGRNG